jgi:hypothetical protein
MAYEWMFRDQYRKDVPPYMLGKMQPNLNEFEIALHRELRDGYVDYINSLNLKHPKTGAALTLCPDGTGSFYDYLVEKLEDAATKYFRYLEEKNPKAVDAAPEDYIHGKYQVIKRGPGGEHTEPGLDKGSWLRWENGRAKITGIRDMEELGYLKRMKNCPAFDSLELLGFENEEFGPSDQKLSHFDVHMAKALHAVKEDYPEEAEKYMGSFAGIEDDPLIQDQLNRLNPLYFIRRAPEGMCKHLRIRVGSMDPHTSFSTSALVALMAAEQGCDVDYEFTWEKNHGLCDYTGELCEWIEEIIER